MRIETRPRRKHSISLTPLIDVVFILLLFFMLATNFTDWRQITLATGTTASGQHADKPTVVVQVAPDGGLRYAGRQYSTETLLPVLQRRDAAEPLAAIIIRPAADTMLGPTVSVLDALAATGLPVALSRPPGVGAVR